MVESVRRFESQVEDTGLWYDRSLFTAAFPTKAMPLRDIKVRDTEIEYRYSSKNRLIQPPTANRFSRTSAVALHFQWTTVTLPSIGSGSYMVHANSITAAGESLVTETRTARCNKIHTLLDKPQYNVYTAFGAVEAFEHVVSMWEYVMKNFSVCSDNSYVSFTFAAVNSPFFYPLNHTNVKYLTGTHKEKSDGINYLHKTTSALWEEVVKTLETSKPAISLTLTDVKGSPTGGTIAMKADPPNSESLLGQMINTLGTVSNVRTGIPTLSATPVKKRVNREQIGTIWMPGHRNPELSYSTI